MMKKYFKLSATCIAALLLAAGITAHAASFTFTQPGAAGASPVSSTSFDGSSVDESTVRKSSSKREPKSKKAAANNRKPEPTLAKEASERTKVHPDVAVKDTKPEEVVLPGVMKIAGESAQALDFTRTQVVNVNDTGSATVVVALEYSNHIQTPWINPGLKYQDGELKPLDPDKNDNNIFFTIPDGISKDVQIWLKDPVTRKVKGLILKPQAGINGQNIILRDTGASKGNAPKTDSYVAQLQRHAEQVAFGSAPDGYSEIQPSLPAIVRNGLVITATRLYSSADTDIYVYDVANPGPAKAMLTEQEFDGSMVTAVSIFPKPLLNAKEHAKVIVEAKKGR